MNADQRFAQVAQDMGLDFSTEIKIGGHYAPVVRDQHALYVSGQIPRVGAEVQFVGVVGESLNLAQARQASAICAMRALAFLQRAVGGLDAIHAILRITVYVRSAPSFTQQSEVADGASDLLCHVLGACGIHTRTSVGVLQLPKGAAVELDLIATCATGESASGVLSPSVGVI